MINFKKIFSFSAILITIINASHASECTKMKVSGVPHYPPAIWANEETAQMSGAVVEITKKALSSIDIETEAVYVGPWSRVLHLAEHGKLDGVIGAYINEEREKWGLFIEPVYGPDPNNVFMKKDKPIKYEKWDDLKGLVGSTKVGDSYGQEFDMFEKEHLDIERVPGMENAFLMLDKERIDYVIYAKYPSLSIIKKLGLEESIVPIEPPFRVEDLWFTISKKSPCVHRAEEISQALKHALADNGWEKAIRAAIKIAP